MNPDALRLSKTSQASSSTSPSKIQQKLVKSLSKCEQGDQEQESSLYDFAKEQCNTKFQRFQTIQPERIQQSDFPYNPSNLRKTQPKRQEQDISKTFSLQVLVERFGNFYLKKHKKNDYDHQSDQCDQYGNDAMCIEEGKSTNIKKELDENENENKTNENDDQFQ